MSRMKMVQGMLDEAMDTEILTGSPARVQDVQAAIDEAAIGWKAVQEQLAEINDRP